MASETHFTLLLDTNATIPLNLWPSVGHFNTTIQRILAVKNNETILVKPDGLEVRDKTKTDRALALCGLSPSEQQICNVREKIIGFIKQNARWYGEINTDKTLHPLFVTPIFAGDLRGLNQVLIDVCGKKEKLESDLDREFRSKMRNVPDYMDVYLISSDGQRIGAHRAFLNGIPYFKNAFSHLRDGQKGVKALETNGETIRLFLDIVYETVDPQKFTRESFDHLLLFSELIHYEKILIPLQEILKEKGKHKKIDLSSMLSFFLKIPVKSLNFTLFSLFMSAAFPKSKSAVEKRSLLENFQKWDEDSPNNILCQFLLGCCYQEDEPRMAFNLFNKTHNAGFPFGTFELAMCFQDGTGTRQDLPQAFELFTIAAKAGIGGACVSLGSMYEHRSPHPDGLEKNMEAAVRWYEKGVDLENRGAAQALERCFGGGAVLPQPVRSYRPSPVREPHFPHRRFVHAKRVTHSSNEMQLYGVDKLLIDATAGLPQAMFLLGQWYEKGGAPIKKSYPQALDWYRQAAEKGHKMAAARVTVLQNVVTIARVAAEFQRK